MSRKKPSLALNKVQAPGFLKYDLSKIPPKLRRKSNVCAASSSAKFVKKSAPLSIFNEELDVPNEVPPTMEEVSAASCSIPIENNFKLYCLGIVESQYFCPCNGSMTVFALADFDETRKELQKHQIQTVRRKAVKFEGDTRWICFCSCNPLHAEYVDALSANLLTSYEDFSETKCIHVRVVEKFTDEFDDISPDVYFSEHSYGKKETEGLKENADLVELPFGDDYCLVLCGIMPGVVTVFARKLQCFTCQKVHCCHTNHIHSYIEKASTDTVPDIVLKLMRGMVDETSTKTFIYHTLSKRSIQFRLDVALQATFLDPVAYCIKEDGVLKFLPFESDICSDCGSQLEAECSLQGNQPMPLFCKYQVYEVSVFCKKCTSCTNILFFDGGDVSVLNMRSFLMHHSILRDYMWHFLYARCTLYAYFNIWMEELSDMGINADQYGMSYVKFRHSWYGFLSLLDIDYDIGFQCEICGPSPSTIVCDATSLAFRKSFVQWQRFNDSEAVETTILIKGSHKERVVIKEKKYRQSLMQYCLGVPPLCEADFTSMKKSISRSFPPLGPLLNIMENIGCFESCPPEHRPLLELLGSSSPACALIPYNVVNEQILSKMFDSPKDISRDAELLNSIQINIPLLFEILKSVSFEISPEYKEIISEVFAKSKDTFPNPSACTSDQFPKPKTEDPLTKEELDIASQTAFFPKLVPIRQRGRYTADKGKFNAESCRKDSTRHPTLLPGIFTVFCEHGICYGFQIMENNESPNVPFTFIRTRFLTAPSVVIYDNACNLHAYFLNRDPLFVQNTTFAVDNLHWRNHKSCSKIYHAKNIPLLDGVNTQMVEQNNSKLRKLKSQLSYMNHQNFMSHLKFFLWHCNKRVLDKK